METTTAHDEAIVVQQFIKRGCKMFNDCKFQWSSNFLSLTIFSKNHLGRDMSSLTLSGFGCCQESLHHNDID